MNATHKQYEPLMSGHSEKGFTLVEMLVGLMISVLLLTGMVSLMSSSNQAYRDLNEGSEQQENGRYALHILKEDIQHAGFYGEYYLHGETTAATLPSPCTALTAAALEGQMAYHIQGSDADDFAGCVLDDYKVGTDVLVIRRAQLRAPGMGPTAVRDDKKFYIQSAPSKYVLRAGSANNSEFLLTKYDSGDFRDLREYYVIVYYIANNNTAADGIPTLKREILQADGTWTSEPLVEGIENMQLDYGITDKYSDGRPLKYSTAPAATEWMYVTTVQVNLLARTARKSADTKFTDTKIYNMGAMGTVDLPDDGFKRHVFTSTVRIANIAGWLATKAGE